MSNQPVNSLDIFPSFGDRSAYQNATGTQAPIFDPSIGAIKNWADPAAASLPATALMTYTKFNGDQTNPALVPFTVPAGAAARVNLPGKPAYAKYFIQPTDATAVFSAGIFTQPVTVQPSTLSLKIQADALAALVGATVEDAENRTHTVIDTWPADEPRRPWIVVYKDDSPSSPSWSYAGDLIADQYKAGIGAPGHWDTTGGKLAWVVDPIADGGEMVYSAMPAPKRALASDEKLIVVAVGGLGFKDVVVQKGTPVPVGSGGIDPAVLTKLVAQIQFMYTEMGGK